MSTFWRPELFVSRRFVTGTFYRCIVEESVAVGDCPVNCYMLGVNFDNCSCKSIKFVFEKVLNRIYHYDFPSLPWWLLYDLNDNGANRGEKQLNHQNVKKKNRAFQTESGCCDWLGSHTKGLDYSSPLKDRRIRFVGLWVDNYCEIPIAVSRGNHNIWPSMPLFSLQFSVVFCSIIILLTSTVCDLF